MMEMMQENPGGFWLLVIASIMSIIEIAPIKVNPWGALLKAFHRFFNRDLYDRFDKIDKKLEYLEQEEKAKQRIHNESMARQLRAQIMAFEDSCRRKELHTRQMYEDIFRTIDDYTRLCDEKKIKNHYIEASVEYITNVYKQCQINNEFL